MGISTYLKETKTELTHVSWPTRKQSILFTVLVIVISVVTAFFLGFFDFLFSRVLSNFIS
jgi:preprotein translocase SecE subunit